jgi:hypothetical protein
VEAVGEIEIGPGEAGGGEHGGGDVDVGGVGVGAEVELGGGVNLFNGEAEGEAGGAELDGEEGPGEGGVMGFDLGGDLVEVMDDGFGGVAVAEVVIAGVEEERGGLGEGDELIEEVDAGGEGGATEGQIEGLGEMEIIGEARPEAEGGRAIEDDRMRGGRATEEAMAEGGDFRVVPVQGNRVAGWWLALADEDGFKAIDDGGEAFGLDAEHVGRGGGLL